jgi:hypothetical protein
MQEERKTLFEARVSAGRNTFFIDARQAVNGHYYISVTDSRRQEDGTFQQQKVIVFEESVKEFADAVSEASKIIGSLYGDRRKEEIAEIRKTHPRAFMKWEEEEEKKLEKLFRKGTDIEALSREFGRSQGSVLARLERMKLIEPAASGE